MVPTAGLLDTSVFIAREGRRGLDARLARNADPIPVSEAVMVGWRGSSPTAARRAFSEPCSSPTR